MSWIQILDILFCTLLIRFLLSWLLANRHVARFMLFIFSLTVFVIVVNRLDLPLTKTLTSAISLPLALIVTLIFLPDLRRAFPEKKLKKLFLLFKGEQSDVNHSLLSAVIAMARMRCGALIVIPGDDELGPFLSGGEEYDAQITKSLVLSIFNTKAPRHDGAMVVQQNRIVRVGAVLPLSRTEYADERWGTRHLAALGLSEQCDATVIVVSEERGSISIARGGRIDILTSDSVGALSQAVSHVLYPEIESGAKKRMLRVTTGLWLAALVLASASFGLNRWFERPFRYRSAEELLIATQAAIHFKNLPENLFLKEYSTESSRIYARIPVTEAALFPKEFEFTVDLTDYTEGPSEIQLTRRMLSSLQFSAELPADWSFSRFEPEKLQFVLAREQDAVLRVVPQFTALKPEFSLRSILVSPSSLPARIKGELSEEQQIIHTLSINLSHIDDGGKYQYMSILQLPPSVRLLDWDPEETVRVDIVVERKAPE